jgi:hypothetical protein
MNSRRVASSTGRGRARDADDASRAGSRRTAGISFSVKRGIAFVTPRAIRTRRGAREDDAEC